MAPARTSPRRSGSPAAGTGSEHFRSYVKDRDVVQIVGFAKDPNTAFVLSNVGLDKAVIYEYDVAARKRKEILFKHRFFDAGGVLINRYKGAATSPSARSSGSPTRARAARTDVQWTSPKAQALDKGIRDALGLRRQPLTVTDPATGQSAEIDYDVDATYPILVDAGPSTSSSP